MGSLGLRVGLPGGFLLLLASDSEPSASVKPSERGDLMDNILFSGKVKFFVLLFLAPIGAIGITMLYISRRTSLVKGTWKFIVRSAAKV